MLNKRETMVIGNFRTKHKDTEFRIPSPEIQAIQQMSVFYRNHRYASFGNDSPPILPANKALLGCVKGLFSPVKWSPSLPFFPINEVKNSDHSIFMSAKNCLKKPITLVLAKFTWQVIRIYGQFVMLLSYWVHDE